MEKHTELPQGNLETEALSAGKSSNTENTSAARETQKIPGEHAVSESPDRFNRAARPDRSNRAAKPDRSVSTEQFKHSGNKSDSDRSDSSAQPPHSNGRFTGGSLNGEAVRFIIVGLLNTLLGTALTFSFYNLAGMSYWLSSGLSYVLASIFSFFMNKRFTFNNKDSLAKSGLRFALNIAVCYGLAFGLAKPGVLLVLSRYPALSDKLLDNAALLTGMVLFTGFNFVGQKFYAFRKEK